jgi:hypothetical protein
VGDHAQGYKCEVRGLLKLNLSGDVMYGENLTGPHARKTCKYVIVECYVVSVNLGGKGRLMGVHNFEACCVKTPKNGP